MRYISVDLFKCMCISYLWFNVITLCLTTSSAAEERPDSEFVSPRTRRCKRGGERPAPKCDIYIIHNIIIQHIMYIYIYIERERELYRERERDRYICMYIYIYIVIQIYIYTYIHTCVYIYIYIYIHTHVTITRLSYTL